MRQLDRQFDVLAERDCEGLGLAAVHGDVTVYRLATGTIDKLPVPDHKVMHIGRSMSLELQTLLLRIRLTILSLPGTFQRPRIIYLASIPISTFMTVSVGHFHFHLAESKLACSVN